MGYRLSKIYTRTGDKGTTGLGDGKRVDKDHPRVEAFGDIDELNSCVGIVLAHTEIDVTVRNILIRIQNELFDLGGELCLPGYEGIFESHVTQLENDLDKLNAELNPLKEFILPGGHPAAAFCHLARAICRRAERRMITLDTKEEIRPQIKAYINRLSDLLFVIARFINHQLKIPEPLWQHERKKK